MERISSGRNIASAYICRLCPDEIMLPSTVCFQSKYFVQTFYFDFFVFRADAIWCWETIFHGRIWTDCLLLEIQAVHVRGGKSESIKYSTRLDVDLQVAFIFIRPAHCTADIQLFHYCILGVSVLRYTDWSRTNLVPFMTLKILGSVSLELCHPKQFLSFASDNISV